MPPPLRSLLFAAAFLLACPFAHAHAPAPAGAMRAAADAFLAALTPAQLEQTRFAFDDKERENWHFVPRRREGLPLKDMTPTQKDLALALLRTGLSERGAANAEAIIALELVLKEIEGGAARRDPGLYYVTVFGTPGDDAPWGWRFEGHHLAFNFTVIDGHPVFFAPSFMGANPAEVPHGPKKGLRILGAEDDQGRALVQSLDDAQRRIAVISTRAPFDIVTGNRRRVDPLHPAGLAAAHMTPAQRAQLMALVTLYVERWRPEIARETLAKIDAAGVDRIAFAWAGGFERGQGNYYRIQGPTFLIEFDNTQNDANHIHTAFRDFKGDFGHDALAEHYRKDHPH